MKHTNTVSVVIGSWGSYNQCNERALGSGWLDLAYYSDWDEIVGELEKQGFELGGIDAELFVQDVDGLPSGCTNWDYMSPKALFEVLQEAEVLEDSYKYEIMTAFIEVRCFSDFMELVKAKGDCWNEDIYIYRGCDWEEYGRDKFDDYERQIDDRLLDFFDFESLRSVYRV
jgi:hypothetical protein